MLGCSEMLWVCSKYAAHIFANPYFTGFHSLPNVNFSSQRDNQLHNPERLRTFQKCLLGGVFMFPKVVQVIPMKEYSVFVYFEDGKMVCYDMKNMLDKEVFKPLKDVSIFVDACTVMNDTLAWDISGNRDASRCIDIDPDTLYELPYCEEQIA